MLGKALVNTCRLHTIYIGWVDFPISDNPATVRVADGYTPVQCTPIRTELSKNASNSFFTQSGHGIDRSRPLSR
jgi:hypothetical protein